jgi:hypothetical protein
VDEPQVSRECEAAKKPSVIRAADCQIRHIQGFLDGLYSGARHEGLSLVQVPSGTAWLRVGSAFGRLGLSRTMPGIVRRAILPLAWASDRDAFPLQYVFRIVPWVYDCWEPDFMRWDSLLARMRPPVAFFSCRTNSDRFAARFPGTRCAWVPEAVDAEAYDRGPSLVDRSLGVLELGRRWASFSDRLYPVLVRRNVAFLRSGADFPQSAVPNDRLRSVLANTRVLLCFPKSTTHPVLAGGVQTVTYRYFEGIASRCILVGRCPAELERLWGYNPVLEVDLDTDPEILAEMALNPARFQALVDRNYDRLLEVGLWRHRMQLMAHLASP